MNCLEDPDVIECWNRTEDGSHRRTPYGMEITCRSVTFDGDAITASFDGFGMQGLAYVTYELPSSRELLISLRRGEAIAN